MKILRRLGCIAGLSLVGFNLAGCFDDLFDSDDDRTPPTITASISPAPNEAGWNNGDVVVRFACADVHSKVVSCSPPETFRQEGAGQVASGMAIDSAGNIATVRVTVNIDKTPPQITVVSPEPGAAVESATALVEASLADTLSGVSWASCNGNLAILSANSFTDEVALDAGRNEIRIAAGDEAGNHAEVMAAITYIGPRVAAIVDVLTSYHENFADVPDEYTGLRFGEATGPYIPGETGNRVLSELVFASEQIWWFPLNTRTSIWVRYDSVPPYSQQRVLVDYRVQDADEDSPSSIPSCPDGFQPVSGTIQFPGPSAQGVLSYPGFGLDIWPGNCVERVNVLCGRYLPRNRADTFISNMGLSTNNSPAPACAAFGEANDGTWPMHSDQVNIIGGCEEWRYLCYGKSKVLPSVPNTIGTVQREDKLDLVEKYAPRVWFGHNEAFWPSSVTWAFPHLRRTICSDTFDGWQCDLPQGTAGASYWLVARDELQSPSDTLPFFYGCDGQSTGNPCALDDAPVYAFWVEKLDPVLDEAYVDLIYFFYYPYNRGKHISLIDTVFGNHVGDWEHVSIRLTYAYDDQGQWTLQPAQMYLSAHSFGGVYEWADVPKTADTHPVVYAAVGSHGLWLEPGRHVYETIFLGLDLAELVDWTAAGFEWDTWRNVEAFDYTREQALSGGDWPSWMSTEYAEAGDCGDPSDPACGAIWRWGNPRWGQVAGQWQLERGPTGPVAKPDIWEHGYLR